MIIVIASYRETAVNADNKEYIKEYNRAWLVESWDDDRTLRYNLKTSSKVHSITSSVVISLEANFS